MKPWMIVLLVILLLLLALPLGVGMAMGCSLHDAPCSTAPGACAAILITLSFGIAALLSQARAKRVVIPGLLMASSLERPPR
jgi:hypothetical protein